ncbi:hypothetical protein ACFQ73_03050 [Amycolatopsis japonica]|uniref:DUF6414 family protein n=1 Tax=Amycolatopsis japonica TaxID=208439 RepID=UPI00366ACA04
MLSLREYLYVDADKVRSLLTQLDGGVAEETRRTEKTIKTTTGGVKSIASHERNWGTEEYVQKSLADAIYSDLEEILEVNQLLTDVSSILASPEAWTNGSLQRDMPPGTLIRVTSQGSLFDARYVGKLFAGIGSTILGMSKITPQLFEQSESRKSGSQKVKGGSRQRDFSSTPDLSGQIEDEIKDFPTLTDGEDLNPEFLRAFVRIARGVFQPGLHLSLLPCSNKSYAVNIRLQEGRRHLESNPEMVFARYGFSPQQWTVVGTLGCHSPGKENAAPDGSEIAQAFIEGDINRNKFAQGLNAYVEHFARIGFADVPQYPSFSLVPLAVYRTVGTNNEMLPASL